MDFKERIRRIHAAMTAALNQNYAPAWLLVGWEIAEVRKEFGIPTEDGKADADLVKEFEDKIKKMRKK